MRRKQKGEEQQITTIALASNSIVDVILINYNVECRLVRQADTFGDRPQSSRPPLTTKGRTICVRGGPYLKLYDFKNEIVPLRFYRCKSRASETSVSVSYNLTAEHRLSRITRFRIFIRLGADVKVMLKKKEIWIMIVRIIRPTSMPLLRPYTALNPL